MICPKIWTKIPLKNEKNPLPADVRGSKTSLLKFTNLNRQANSSYPANVDQI